MRGGVYSRLSWNSLFQAPCARISVFRHNRRLRAARRAGQTQAGDTEIWKPVPAVVTPAAECNAPPSDAIVLFDGKNVDEWVNVKDKQPAVWDVHDGVMTVNKQAAISKPSGGSRTTSFTWNGGFRRILRVPIRRAATAACFWPPPGRRCRVRAAGSGFVQQQDLCERPGRQLYKQAIPLANPNRKPGEWQTYDVVWTAPRSTTMAR